VTAAGGPEYARYRAGGSDEWLMRIGSAQAPPILFVPPLFEEMNRTRALITAAMRGLAERGFCCWLPDLPGTGESERALEQVSWEDWRHGVRAAGETAAEASGRVPVVAAIRGGCLIDDAASASAWWRLAPVTGDSLTRDMGRTALTGGVEWAGYAPSPSLRSALEAAIPSEVEPLRTLRLTSDPAAADWKLEGPALWRRSEPGTSQPLAAAIADDIASWARSCAGS